MLDYVGLLPVELLLGLIQQVEKLDLEKLEKSIETINWSDPKSIYSLNIPSPILHTIEDLQRRLNIESESEGKIITPTWYLKQLIFQSIGMDLKKELDVLINLSSNLYLSAINWKDKEHVLYGVTLALRGGEFRNKFLAHQQTLKHFVELLDKGRIEKGIPWPTWDWDNWTQKVENLFDQLTIFYAESIQHLVEYSDLQDFPDYFGRAVHMIGEESLKRHQRIM